MPGVDTATYQKKLVERFGELSYFGFTPARSLSGASATIGIAAVGIACMLRRLNSRCSAVIGTCP